MAFGRGRRKADGLAFEQWMLRNRSEKQAPRIYVFKNSAISLNTLTNISSVSTPVLVL